MRYDIYFSLAQTEVDGAIPPVKMIFENFFDQVRLADDLGFETAWISEAHLSSQTQKKTSFRTIPDLKGEIGLNTDTLHLAHHILNKTKNIKIGAAFKNLLSNGGPVAHAESVAQYLAINRHIKFNERIFELGLSDGQFDFVNAPYNIRPKSEMEMFFWSLIKPKAFEEAAEIFVRLLLGEELSSSMITPKFLNEKDFKSEEEWKTASALAKEDGLFEGGEIQLKKFFDFEILSLIPLDYDLDDIQVSLNTQNQQILKDSNKYLPVRMFDFLSMSNKDIEEAHEFMKSIYRSDGGRWKRWYLPRTLIVFINDDANLNDFQKTEKAKSFAFKSWESYWHSVTGKKDPAKIEASLRNTMYGSPEEVAEKICTSFHPHDRLVLWFDFHYHDNEGIKKSMRAFKEKVVPLIENYGKD